MALVDELTITAHAGRGGDGVVRWLHLKGKEFSGPAGGNGGRGGDVYIRGVRDIALLAKYTGAKHFQAQSGEHGGSKSMHGKNGEDLVIDLPVGSVVTNLATRERFDVIEEGAQILILKGGRGGLGNEYFKSSVNRKPEESTPGVLGESGTFHIELRLVADAGLVGLPNAGKSSLLNALTNARSKVGAYAFTTLDPSLGALYEFVLADIPGLIEGASAGRGLGHKFLRHVARTRVLIHCLSLEEGTETLMERYLTVRRELAEWGEELAAKRELVVLTKTDTVSSDEWAAALTLFQGAHIDAAAVSVLDDGSVKRLRDRIVSMLRSL